MKRNKSRNRKKDKNNKWRKLSKSYRSKDLKKLSNIIESKKELQITISTTSNLLTNKMLNFIVLYARNNLKVKISWKTMKIRKCTNKILNFFKRKLWLKRKWCNKQKNKSKLRLKKLKKSQLKRIKRKTKRKIIKM